MKDAPALSRNGEFVFGMGQRKHIKYAIMKDAPNMPRKEEYAVGTGRRTRVLSPNEKLEHPLRKVQPGDLMKLTARATLLKSPTPNKLLNDR